MWLYSDSFHHCCHKLYSLSKVSTWRTCISHNTHWQCDNNSHSISDTLALVPNVQTVPTHQSASSNTPVPKIMGPKCLVILLLPTENVTISSVRATVTLKVLQGYPWVNWTRLIARQWMIWLRDRGIMRLCAHIIGDLLHNWANPA